MTELFWLTFDELVQGVEYWVFNKNGERKYPRTNVVRLANGLLRKDKDGFLIASYKTDLKYLPAPKDRPKPNIWDDYIDTNGDFLIAEDHYIAKQYEKKTYVALSAWAKHIAETEFTDDS